MAAENLQTQGTNLGHALARVTTKQAEAGIDGRKRDLGYYLTEEEAAIAYNVAAVSAFGEFASINNTNQK